MKLIEIKLMPPLLRTTEFGLKMKTGYFEVYDMVPDSD